MSHWIIVLLPVLAAAVGPAPVGSEVLESDAAVFWSSGRTFRATGEFGTGTMEFVPLRRFELRDAAGRVLYERAGTGQTVLDVADNGVVVGIDFDGPVSGRAKLHFYDRQGVEQGSAEVGFLNQRAFSEDGSTYWVLDGREGLRAFASAGKELYNLGPGNRFAVSADGRRCALAQDSAVVLFEAGQRVAVIAGTTPFTRQLSLSDDGALVGWVERNRLVVHRFGESSPRFESGPPEPGMQFISLDIGPAGEVLAGLDEGRPHRRGLVYLFDEGGVVAWRQELEYERWNITVPAVRFGAGRSFEVRTAARLDRYEY